MSEPNKRERKVRKVSILENFDMLVEVEKPEAVHASLSRNGRDHLNLIYYKNTGIEVKKEHVEIYFPLNMNVKYSELGLVASTG